MYRFNTFSKPRASRVRVALGLGLMALAFLAAVPELKAQTGSKGLKLRNQDSRCVEYGLSKLGAAAPEKTWSMQPGGSTVYSKFFTPDHDTFWWRYQGEKRWQSATVPANPDSVYRWRFLGGQRGADGKPRAGLEADPERK